MGGGVRKTPKHDYMIHGWSLSNEKKQIVWPSYNIWNLSKTGYQKLYDNTIFDELRSIVLF